MNKAILIGILMMFIVGCGETNTLTGTAVADVDDTESDQAEPVVDADSEIPSTADNSEQKPYEADVVQDGCQEDSTGTVRLFEGDKKTVHRNECLGGLLVDYGCEDGKLVSETKRCPNGCEIVDYHAECK